MISALLLPTIAALLLVLACGSLTPPTPSSGPIMTSTPDIEATVEVRVQQRLAEGQVPTATARPKLIVTPYPTYTLYPTYTPYSYPTPLANISAVEAKGRLRIYFQDVEERGETSALHKSLIAGFAVPRGCDPVAIFYPPAYENCPRQFKSYAEESAFERRKESARAGVCPGEFFGCSNLTAEYHGQGTRLITVRGTLGRFHTTAGFPPQEFEEHWWLFESGEVPPKKRTD